MKNTKIEFIPHDEYLELIFSGYSKLSRGSYFFHKKTGEFSHYADGTQRMFETERNELQRIIRESGLGQAISVGSQEPDSRRFQDHLSVAS